MEEFIQGEGRKPKKGGLFGGGLRKRAASAAAGLTPPDIQARIEAAQANRERRGTDLGERPIPARLITEPVEGRGSMTPSAAGTRVSQFEGGLRARTIRSAGGASPAEDAGAFVKVEKRRQRKKQRMGTGAGIHGSTG